MLRLCTGENQCIVRKSCECENYPEVNITDISSNITLYGINDTAVNISLTKLGQWDYQSVQQLCKGINLSIYACME